MSEYSIGFAEKLIDTAKIVTDEGLDNVDAKRTILYLSCLASEIVLKGLLEQAGLPVSKIRACNHHFSKLLTEIGKCKILYEVTKGSLSWVPATKCRSIEVDKRFRNATIGTILSAEDNGASRYPNEIRYGDTLRSYPPELHLKAAVALLDWAKINWGSIRKFDLYPAP